MHLRESYGCLVFLKKSLSIVRSQVVMYSFREENTADSCENRLKSFPAYRPGNIALFRTSSNPERVYYELQFSIYFTKNESVPPAFPPEGRFSD